MFLGSWQLDTLSGGTFRPDGGTMFGLVPKPLWEKLAPADERNRILLATNCALARDGTHTLLIDTGYGGKLSEKEREINAAQSGEPLLAGLAALGLAAEDIDLVVLSHLHFDHAGGGTRREADGTIAPAFSNARYIVQRGEWEDATGGAPELAGAYPLENLLPLYEAGRIDFIDGDVEIVPGLSSLVTGGHTRRHQALILESAGQTAIYPGDLCPTSAHLRRMWGMGYDVEPLETRRQKPKILGRAADEGWLVLFDHDPQIAACRLRRDNKQEFAVIEPRNIL
jgi:glyoxylase-like metal-dependent hydrolase (beta-lactamase superfamily II)